MSLREMALTVALALTTIAPAVLPATAAAGQAGADTTSTVSAIAAGQTDTFVDVSQIGRTEADFVHRWIRIVTAANPDGFVTTVLAFDSETGTFTLQNAVPAGAVAAGDAYLVGGSPWSVGSTGLSRYLMATLEPGCRPAGTDGPDVIICRETDSVGVAAGDGNDDVVVVAGATIDVSDAGFSVVRLGVAATAVETGEGDDSVLNAGDVSASTSAVMLPLLAPPAPVPGLPQAYAALFTVNSESTGIDAGAGEDEIANTGSVTTSSSSVILPGVPAAAIPGLATVDTSTKSNARSTAIAGGDGADTIHNLGEVSSTATAAGIGVGISIVSVPDDQRRGRSRANGNVQATAAATGLSGGSGNDTVTNRESVNSEATANALAVAGAFLEVKGNAAVGAQSTANAAAVGVDLGPGHDDLVNEGDINATATARAGALSVTVAMPDDAESGSPALKSAVTGGARATARATGISADGQTTENELDPELINDGDVIGVRLQYSQTRASGNDTVTNSGAVDASADALSGAVGVSVTLRGQSSSKITSQAEGSATAIDLGSGDDTLTNSGTLTAAGSATATTLNASIGIPPESTGSGTAPTIKSAAAGGSTARARAVGVSADGTDPDVTYEATLTAGDALGVSIREVRTHTGGDDTVTNSGAIAATALATASGQGASITAGGSAAAELSSTADAQAAGIDLGAGSDTLTNTVAGTISATAMAQASAQNVALGISTESTSASSAVEGGATARSRATGLAADSLSTDVDRTLGLEATTSLLTVRGEQRETRTGGDDIVTNDGTIEARADSWTDALGVGITINGAAAAKIQSEAEAVATGIELGAGSDTLTNSGTVTAEAAATALALNVALGLAQSGSGTSAATPPTIKSGAEGSTTAEARAIGVSADSAVHDDVHLTLEATTTINPARQTLQLLQTRTHTGGDDNVTNSGDVTADARANAGGIGVGVTIHGAAAAKLQSTAEADAASVDLGGGSDTLTNTGTLSAAARANAVALDVAVGVSGDSPTAKSAADAKTTAQARASGVSADSLTADTETAVTIDVSLEGLHLGFQKIETRTGGDDDVTNHGTIESHATALAGSLGVGVTVKGAASATTRAASEATSRGIDLGGGADTLTNTGAISVSADSTAGAVSAAISTEGRALASDGFWKGGIKAEADAIGIDGAGQGDTLTAVEVVLDDDGLKARYETRTDPLTGDGADVLTNSGNVDVSAAARSGAITGAITSSGMAAAVSDVEVKAEAAGIRAGQGDDIVRNLGSGQMTVAADALAGAITVAVSGKGTALAADALWDGGIKAEAAAVGIDADGGTREQTVLTALVDGSRAEIVYEGTSTSASGADTVYNEQAVEVTASAGTSTLGAAVEAGRGLAATISSTSSEADATAIRGGGGDDLITNHGALLATADAASQAVTIAIAQQGVAVAGNSVWDGGTKATASAVGIDADGGTADTVTTVTLSWDRQGAGIVYNRTEQAATGDDEVVNTGEIGAHATATASQAAVASTTSGLTAAVSDSTAEATATAIRGGDGDDHITNSGRLHATATALAEAGNVALTLETGAAVAGNSVWDGGVTATATAIGIEGDGGQRESVSRVAIDWDGIDRTSLTVAARGDDVIVNAGQVDATASAEVPAVGAAVSVRGVAAALSTATATAHATAIDAGDGDDLVINVGVLTADATASAAALNASGASTGIAISANDFWDGGVSAEARAKGIDGGAGFDTIINAGQIQARTFALTPFVPNASVAITGVPAVLSTSTATSSATAIDAGGGVEADTVVNTGDLAAEARARAHSTNVAVTKAGIAGASDVVWDGGTTATATARGIDSGLGADTIVNEGAIETTADAISASAAVAVAVTGAAAATATSSAVSEATAIHAGDGQDDDVVSNTGRLDASADALALAAGVTVTNAGLGVAGDASWDGGTTAGSTATGIRTGGGADTVFNEGEVAATARAATGAADVSVAVSGVALASATATADADAAAIDAGEGDDTVVNTGELTADADALAVATAVSVTTAGLAVATDAVWDGGTTAESTATGIRTGGGTDTVVNEGAIDTRARAATGVADVAVAVSGVAAASATATAEADATAIDTGEGDDTVVNTGELTADADALALATAVSVTTAGLAVATDAVWDGGTTARSTATGIRTGGGTDTVVNEGDIDTRARAATGVADVAVAVSGVAAASATATAVAEATAIDTGKGDDTVVNTGELTADADALALATAVSVTTAGLAVATDAVWDGGTTAESTATGIRTGGGTDTVVNEGAIDTRARAATGVADVAVAVSGVAAASATATAEAEATAIDTGEGDDTIVNTGELTVDADALAVATAVSVTTAGLAVAGGDVWDGGTTATATARGIDTGSGADVIDNTGTIDVTARALSASIDVPVAVAGVAAAVATSTAIADATAIDARDGADVIINAGRLQTTSNALAGTVTVGVTTAGVAVAGDAAWHGGTRGEATARGIDGGGGADTIVNSGEIDTKSTAGTASAAVSVALAGVAGAIATSTAVASSTAIDTGEGADTVINFDSGEAGRTGRLTSRADTLATAASVSVTLAGLAVSADTVWEGGTTAIAHARGIDTGSGADTVLNDADVEAQSHARTGSVAVAFALEGVAAAVTTATGQSLATAIDTGESAESDVVVNSGALTASAEADAVSAGIGFTKFGVTLTGNDVWDGGTTGEATSRGIFTGGGADTIINAGAIESSADARAISASVAVNVAGVAAAVSTSTAEARSTAIDAGDGDDLIDNLEPGALTVEAIARGSAVNISATGAGVTASSDAAWDGGTHATTTARGIDGGAGADTVRNAAAIDARADASTVSTGVAVTIAGVSAAVSTASSTADAAAIAGGDGHDRIDNGGDLTATADARATGVAVSVGLGIAGAGDAFWDGGTRATGIATGIDGGAGDDAIVHSEGVIEATAEATTHSVAVAASGLASAVAVGSTATATATGIDGGDGADTIVSDSEVVSTAASHAEGVSVSFVAASGLAGAGTLLDNRTRAESTATGIAGGAGDDLIATTERATIAFDSQADTRETAVAVTMSGLTSADASVLATAFGTGLSGGEGDDVLDHQGAITGSASALSRARSVSVTLGVGSAGAAGTAEATTMGMDGGAGNDQPLNRGSIDVESLAEAFGQSVSVTGVGVAMTDAGAVSRARTTGMDGGVGADIVTNRGAIDARATSTTTARSTGVIPVGVTLDRSNAEAEATAIGLDGGADADVLLNAAGATLDVDASSSTVANGVSVSVLGVTRGEAEMTPTATAIGIDGGSGDDVAINDGTIAVSAIADSLSRNSRVNILGSAGGSTGAVALADATGMSGGDGSDWLLNRFSVGVNASSTSTISGASWTLGGAATDRSVLEATAVATGMAGGRGDDWIRNAADVNVALSASLAATGGATAIFGGASANTQLTATAQGYGLRGGEGADTIENAGAVRVASEAAVETTRASVAFAGSPSSDALLVARAEATGFDGGAGSDSLRNDGHLDVAASSQATVSGGARTTFGGSSTGGVGTAEAWSTGIHPGTGANVATNAGTVDVSALAESVVTNSAHSGWIVGVADTRAEGRATASAAGVLGAHGDNLLINDGDLRISGEGAAFGFADASGAHLSFNGDGTSRADARVTTTAAGISAGDGRNMIVNTGRIGATALASTVRNLRTTTNVCSQEVVTVQDCVTVVDEDGKETQVCTDRQETVTSCAEQEVIVDQLPTYAGANGNGLSGDGRATALGNATANAYGIEVGNGDNTIVNAGEIFATASPNARAKVFADGDNFGDAIGTAQVTANATAVGLMAGDGANTIQNHGSITVLADPTARAETTVTGGDICITVLFWTWCGGGGKGIGTSEATINAQAFGILAGDGNNSILNDGTITVTSAPVVDGFTARVSSADSATVRTSVTSRAVGIQTGDGDNRVLNAAGGVIDVTARDASACNGTCTTTLEAVGIRTGGGDDLIVNEGTIGTSVVGRTGVITSGIAIDGGAGNDTVVLGLGSRTVGMVLLGSGDDTLEWTATAALDGIAYGGDGLDTFALGGSADGSFALSEIGQTFREFDLFRKRGSSTWDLFGDRRIDWTVDEGTLGVNDVITGTLDTSAGAVNALIAVRPTGTIRRDDGLAPAVRLGGGGTLTNEGLVEATSAAGVAVSTVGNGNHVVNEGTIAGVGDALALEGHANVVTNRGSVVAGGTAIHSAGSQGLVVNEGLVSSLGATAPAIVLAGSGDSLVNRGLVTAQHAAVSLEGGNGGLVVNDGGGVLVSTGGVAVQGGAGNDRVENHGRITGGAGIAIDLGAGDDQLLITPGSIIEGAAFGGAGFDTTVLGGAGSGSFDLGGIGTSFQQFDLFAKQGPSTWTLFGEATADWRVDQGVLVIDGGILGSVFTAFNSFNPVIAIGLTGRVWRNDTQAAVILNGGATLVNDGRVESTAFQGVALQALGSGNVVSNRGQIRALGTGLQVTGDGNQISNTGLVQALGAGAAVSVTGVGNAVSNGGLIDASFGGDGLRLTGDGNAVFNAGRVQSGNTGVAIGGGSGALVNSGVITGNTGVLMEGPQALVSNSGGIFTRGVGVALAGSGGSISNSGSITSDNAAAVFIEGAQNLLVNDGLVAGVAGVTVAGRGNTIVNRGRVIAGSVGIQATGDETTVVNSGLISSGGTGIVLAGSGATLSNQGEIRAHDTAVLLGSAGVVVNAPGGLIESVSGIAIRGSNGRDGIENHGWIAGAGVAIDLGGGDDELFLAPGSQIVGTADGGDGSDLLTLAGRGLGRVDLSTFTGFDTLRKDDSSRWTLTGSGDMDWTIVAGDLIVEGSLLGAGTVRAGGRLGGSGAVGSLTNEGTVSPGSSIGTLTVIGDYEHGAEATLEIEGSITGLSDRLEVTGRAVLHGGTVSVLPEARQYGIATAHTILRAAGGVTGTFGAAQVGLEYLDAILDHESDNVSLTLIRNDISFVAMGDTWNQQALGTALDANKKAMAHGDFKGLMDQFLFIDEAQQRSALFSLSGELHPTTTRALHRTGQRFFSAAMDRQMSAQGVTDDHRTVWMDAFGFSGRLESDSNAASASYRSVGLVTGIDVMATDTLRVGTSFGYAPGSTRLGTAGGGTARFHSFHPALYAEYNGGRWSLTTGAGYGHYQVRATREVAVGQIARQAAADYRADQFSGLVRLGRMLRSARAGSTEAFGELQYSTLRQHGFSESGAGSAGLTETRLGRTESLRSLVGVRVSWEPTVRGLRVRPQVTAGWAHESLDDRGQMTASLGGALVEAGFQPFTTRGLAESRDSAVLQAGATTGFSESSEGFMTYNGHLTGRGSEHGFVAGLRFAW